MGKGFFKKSDDDVYEANFEEVLNVLQDVSPWQAAIRKNLAIARKNWSKNHFQILDETAFRDAIKGMTNSDGVYGLTDKQTGTIFMREWGNHSRNSPLLMVLHECVHLVSAPATQCALMSTFHHYLGSGLLEGTVEMVAERILAAQGFPPTRLLGMRGHPDVLPIAVEFCRIAGEQRVMAMLFDGSLELLQWRRQTYPDNRWSKIMQAANAGDKKSALALMKS